MKIKAKRILFTAHSGLGDTLLYIPALKIIRQMYPDAELVCLVNGIARDLFKCIDFIDKTVHVFDRPEHEVEELLIKEANGYEDEHGVHPVADVIVLTHRQKSVIKAALKSKSPMVLTFSYLPALYTPRLHFTPHFSRKKQQEIFCYQKLIRQLNPPLYDEAFEKADFNDICLKADEAVREKIVSELKSRGWDEQKQPHLVMINPLAVTITKLGFNFTPEQWLSMSNELAARNPDVFFVASSAFENEIDSSLLTQSNIINLASQGDIKGLIALISLSNLVISSLTGSAHMAENMCRDVCGLCPYFDSLRWRANGLHQLSMKQAKPSLKPSAYTHLELPEGWKDDEAGWLKKFQDHCQQAIDNMKKAQQK